MELGYNLIITDINKKSLKDNFYKLTKLKLSNKIFLEKLNVYNEANIRMLIKKYKNEYIYVLINNASVNPSINKNGVFANSGKLEKFLLRNGMTI